MKEVRYLQSTDELEITDELGFPKYISINDLKEVDANERELGTETELVSEDGLHVFFYPEGHLSDYYWENENEMGNAQMLYN